MPFRVSILLLKPVMDRSGSGPYFVAHTRMHFSCSEPIPIDRREFVLRVNVADHLFNVTFSVSLEVITSHNGRELLYSTLRCAACHVDQTDGYLADAFTFSQTSQIQSATCFYRLLISI